MFKKWNDNPPVKAIKMDIFAPGSLYVAYGDVIVLKSGNPGLLEDLMAGTWHQSGHRDGVYLESRITEPVCILQVEQSYTLFMERFCLRQFSRSAVTKTLAGSCTDSSLLEVEGYGYDDVRFTDIRSCALGYDNTIFLVDYLHNIWTLSTWTEFINEPTFLVPVNLVKTMLLHSGGNELYSFTLGGRLISVPLRPWPLQYPSNWSAEHIAFNVSTNETPEIIDGSFEEAQLVTSPEDLPVGFIDDDNKLIILGEEKSTIRLIDLESGLGTSLCEGSSGELVLGPLDNCSAGEINAVYMGHTTQTLYIATAEHGLLKMSLLNDLQGKVSLQLPNSSVNLHVHVLTYWGLWS